MPRTDSPEATLADILSTLESKATGSKERCEAYNKLTRHFRENEASLFGADVSKNIARVLKVIKNDVNSSSHEVKNIALQILGACLYDTDIVRHMKKTDCVGMLKTLCLTVHNTKEKSTCSCALWCLKSQNLDFSIITGKADEILMAVEYAMEKWSGISVSVVHECISTIERLNSQAPKQMAGMILRWGKLLLPLVVHGAVQVREGALTVIEATMNQLKEVHKDLVGAMKPVFKQKIIPGLKSFFKEGHKVHTYALKCWSTLVQLFGEELHHASYINEFLPVVELGFKSTEPRVKVAAFQAWQQLIDNFAISQSVIQDPKRIKLVMQVFKHNNARTESVAMEKLTCWWHFLWLLGNKVSPNFDMVAGPLLHFCIGGRPSEQNAGITPKPKSGASPVTPHLKLSNTGIHDLPVFPSLQLLGCEVLAHILGNVEGDEIHHKFKLDPLTHEVVTGPSFFIKHSALLITSAVQLYLSLGKDVPEGLILHSWQWLIAHLKNAIESPAKLDIRETLSTLFIQFQILVQSKTLADGVILRMFQSLCFLPKKILCSSAYSIGGEEMIHGTPAIFITGLLLAPALLPTCSGLDSYHDLFSSLLANGSGNSTGTLGFLQSVMEILKENAQYVQDKETLWRLWSAVEHPLLQHISKTNEINQGDSLEHDFGCSVQTLAFPVIHDLYELPQSLVKSMIKSWSELYKTVNRLAAMVANAEANIVCEEVCSQVLDHYLEKDTVEATEVDMLVQMCRVVVTSLYFSSLGNQPMFRMSVSPKKLAKNRHKPLENIHSVVALLGLLQKKAVALVKDSESFKKSTGVSIQTVLNNLVETFSNIFVQVTSSNVISNLIGQLARPIGDLFADAQIKTSAKVYNSSFDSKLEKLWLDISTCLQSRYNGLFDSDFLEKCSPLLEATFLHPRRQMKNQTMSLWTCTFGKAAFLSYPELLKPVLSKVKAKTMIQLPNWVATISPVIDETPVSQMTQTQAPEPRIPGMPSPHKIHGSFLNRPVSPKPNRSPVRAPASPVSTASAKKKKLNLDGFDDGDFVLIKHTPKKKMVLTEHQKEVMKEKSALPAMYNGLDHSVDASLMAAHFTTDTQMEGTPGETPTPTTSQPFSLFGSVIPPSNQEEKEKEQAKMKSKKPVTNKLERMKAAEKLKRLEDEKNLDIELDTSLRRSSRVREHEEKDQHSDEKWTQFRSKKADISQSPIKSKRKGMKRKMFDNNLIIIDDDDEPTDGEFGTEEEPTDTEFFGNDEESTDIDFGAEDDDIGDSEEHNFKGKLEVNKPTTECVGNDAKGEVETSGKDSGSSGGGVPSSVPQNVLGALDFFQSLSSRSGIPKTSSLSTIASKSSKESLGQDEKASTDNESDIGDSRTIVSKDVSAEHEKAAEPLRSWTQKLNELSTSPRPVSPVMKWSSQNSSSQEKKSRTKSPKRSKKKPTDENEEKGALEKWIVRSPAKTFQGNLNTDIVVANLSQTLVEETQSPTKFANKEMLEKGLSSSIMETPPKNVLENITVSHSNSNRKLFSSQSSNRDYKFVEDSNIVPASPNSKSFRCGTPVLKLKKLTNEEISRYSPSRKNNAQIGTQNETSERNHYENSDKSKRMINVGELMSNGMSQKDHDDFSAFTPLEKGLKEMKSDGFFSSCPSDTDQAMLKYNDNCKTDKVSECSGSENLFSQSERDTGENVTGNCKEPQDILNDSVEKIHPESQTLNSQDIVGMAVAAAAEDKQDKKGNGEESCNVEKSSSASPDVAEPVKRGRGRKRKQITPRKLTPEDIKLKKKKEEEENKAVVKKLSKRLKEKKEQSSERSDDDRSNSKTKIGKKDISHKSGITSQGKQIKKKRKEKSLKKSESNSQSEHIGSPRRSKRHNSGSPNGSTDTSVADSSHEELEVSVFDDILDLEEDTHHVKTLTEIKKDLKKNKNKDRVEKENLKHSEPIKQTEPVKPTEVVRQPSPVTDEKLVQNQQENNHVALIPHDQNSWNAVSENHGKDVNGNNFVKNPEYEDITDSEMDIPAYEVNEKVNENSCVDLPKDTDGGIAQYQLDPVGMDLAAEDVPYLDMSDGVPFIAVKLGESEFPHRMDCKTDGTISSPTTNRVDDFLGMLIDSSDEEKDLPDIEKRYYDGSEDQLSNIESVDSQCETDVNEEKDESFFSDDDVPIAEMTEKVKEKEKSNDKRKKGTLKSKPCRTRLRSKEMKPESSVKGGKQTTAGKKLKTDDNAGNDEKLTQSSVIIEKNDIEVQKELEKSDEHIVQSKETDAELLKVDENKLSNNTNTVDETPRKEIDVLKSNVAAMLMQRNSDSKLMIGSRKFEKKGGVARRSILKPASEGSIEETQSPKRTPFHPITVGRIYSPTASPSASILKKRRLSDDSPSETNSPPTKQRRVSFATPLADVTRVDTERPPSPLVKMIGTESASLTQSGKSIESQSTQGSPSQKNYESSLDSQINNTDPVCPELMGCDQSVEKILPQLTSSIWSRGLGQLVRARNILTIGDLSSLSEGDIHGLPIRSPKVDTVKKVLTKFAEANEARPEMKQQAENLSTTFAGTLDKGISEDISAILADSGSFLDEVNNLTDNVDQFQVPKAPEETGNKSEPCAGSSAKPEINLTEALLHYCDKNDIDVKNLSANDLVKISQNLTAMLSEVNKAIEAVVNTRCRSPWR